MENIKYFLSTHFMVRYGNDEIDEKVIYNSIYFNFPEENLHC
jgi:hypothetical protein